MMPTTITSRVGADGILSVQVPLGAAEANSEVRVTIEHAAKAPLSQEEWLIWLHSLAGRWQGDFERPPQGDFEERDPLP